MCEALGSTGSKSTITPFLKRWKEEHLGAVAQFGMPPTLLQAVKGLYDGKQAEFQQKMEQAKHTHQAPIHAVTEEAQRLRVENKTLFDANSALSATLEHANETIAHQQTEASADGLAEKFVWAEKTLQGF